MNQSTLDNQKVKEYHLWAVSHRPSCVADLQSHQISWSESLYSPKEQCTQDFILFDTMQWNKKISINQYKCTLRLSKTNILKPSCFVLLLESRQMCQVLKVKPRFRAFRRVSTTRVKWLNMMLNCPHQFDELSAQTELCYATIVTVKFSEPFTVYQPTKVTTVQPEQMFGLMGSRKPEP